MNTRRILSTTALLAAVGTGVLGLSGCSSLSGDSHWADAAGMRASDQAASVPTLVASDATDIDLHTNQFAKAGTQLRWRSASGITRTDCRAGAIGRNTTGDASWWPSSAPRQGWSCGWWRVFEQDGTYYAWHNQDTGQGV